MDSNLNIEPLDFTCSFDAGVVVPIPVWALTPTIENKISI